MVSEKADIRKFVFRELHHCSDLSTLTLGILRRRYLEHVGRETLSVEHKQLLKQIVEEELLKMQENSGDESLVMRANPSQKQNKRKRQEDEDEGEKDGQSEDDVVDRKKKSRFELVPPDSPDSGIEKAAHEEPLKEEEEEEEDDEDDDDDDDDDDERNGHDGESDKEQTEKVEMKTKAQHTVRGNRKGRMSSESEEDKKPRQSRKVMDREEEELDSLEDSGEEEKKQQEAKSRDQRRKKRVSSGSEGKAYGKQTGKIKAQKGKREENVKEPNSPESEAVRKVQKEVFGSSSESEEEHEGMKAKGKESNDGESDEEMINKKDSDNVSSDEELKGKVRDEDKDSQSDSSSLPSLEEEEELNKKPKQEEKKKKRGSERKNTDESESSAKGGKLGEENKAVSRLKHYIALCGVRRNYKKLLEGCRSVKAKVAVLKKELEELGVEGQPSIEKCKKARLKREEAQELAELDVGNIITTQGRPKRRAAASWLLPGGSSPPPSAFKRAVNSDSDSENGSTGRVRKRTTDWSNLKGVISDDADSD